MKRLTTVLYVLIIGPFGCSGQINCKEPDTSIGVCLASGICLETVRIMASHTFAGRWSATIDIGLDTRVIKRAVKEIDREHRETLYDKSQAQETGFRHPFQEICLYADFWPLKALTGLHIGIGGRIKDRDGPDMMLGIGYSLGIWKGLRADIMYQMGVMETYKDRQLHYDGIRAGIYYGF